VSRKGRELPAEVVKTINDNYVMPVLLPIQDRVHGVQHRVQDASTAFLHAAVETWDSLQTSAQDGRVRLDSFVEGIKSKFGNTWNDRLVEPAKSLYSTVQKELSEVVQKQPDKGKIESVFFNVKTKLGDAWEQKIKANLKLPSPTTTVSAVPGTVKSAINHRVVQPAEAFYRYALENYRNLSSSANGASVTFSDFLVSLRGRLGSAWNSRLMEPARYLYEHFHGEPAALTQGDDGKVENEDEDVPANTSSPMPTSLHAPIPDSPRGSGSTTPTEQVLYPADVEEDEDVSNDSSSLQENIPPESHNEPEPTPVISVAAPTKMAAKTGSKKKKSQNKKAAASSD